MAESIPNVALVSAKSAVAALEAHRQYSRKHSRQARKEPAEQEQPQSKCDYVLSPGNNLTVGELRAGTSGQR